YSHSALFDFYRKKRVVQEIRKTDELINSICGESPVLFRPPFGVTNPSIRRAIAETSHKVIGWNIRSLDGILKDEDLIFKRVVRRVSPGSVILLHDTSVSTVYILEKLLVFLANQHYTIVPLAQLLDIHED
ncbi:MAG: polysaccharide deacetylase family protein, partial [Sphingobacteriales bacterium]